LDFDMDVEELFERVTVPEELQLEYDTIYRNTKHLAHQILTICPGKADRITAINKLKNVYDQVVICFNGQSHSNT